MVSSILKWSRVLLFLAIILTAVNALGKEECQRQLETFHTRIEGFSGYQPTPTSASDGMGGMGMMMKKKRDDGAELPTNCLNITEESEDKSTVVINCESHACIEHLMDLVADYDELFSEACSPNAVHEFVVDKRTIAVMNALRVMTGCNKCVVTYTHFKKLEARMTPAGCFPTSDKYSCDTDCLRDLGEYYAYWDSMIQGICRKNNPGGCGEGGGMTEGEIWDQVDSMHLKMHRITSALSLCDPDCEAEVTKWVGKWTPLIQDSCISSDGTDLTKTNLILADYKLDQQCNAECKEKVEQVGLQYVTLPSKCKVGLLEVHRSDLVNSVNANRCDGGSSGFLDEMSLAKGFLTLTVLGVGAFIIYFVTKTVYNRVVKGKKNYLPSLTPGKSSRSGSKNNSKRNQFDDEEEVILYDADMDDDRL